MKKSLVAGVVGLALAGSMIASQAQASEGPSFNYFGASYAELDVDHSSDISGFALDLSMTLNDAIFVRAAHESFSRDGMSADLTRVGLGYRGAMNEKTSAYIGGGLANGKFKAGWMNESDTGWQVFGGIASRINQHFELYGELAHYEVFDDGETDVTFGTRFHLSERVSVGAAYIFGDGADRMKLGITVHW